MRHRPLRPSALTAGLGLAAVTAIVLSSAALPALSAGAAASTRAASTRAGSRPVLLINGDRFLPVSSSDGGHLMALLATPGGSLLRVHLGRLDEAIPYDALPYLGHGLDPSLFDLVALQQAEADGRLRVRVGFDGRRPPAAGRPVYPLGPGQRPGLPDSVLG